MQVKVVQGGTDAFRALVYPPPDTGLLNYLNNNLVQARDALGGIASSLVDTTQQLFEKFNGNAVLNAGKTLLYSVGGHMGQNVIYPVAYDQLCNSNYIMQRYIMAEHTINKMYQRNTINGFDETYVDFEPDNKGTERMDYRNVMDGIVQFENDDAYVMHYSHDDGGIYNELNEDGELPILDKLSILDTWENVALALANDIDPTSYDCDEL